MKYSPVCSKFPGFHPLEESLELAKLEEAFKTRLPTSANILNILLLQLQGRFTSETLVEFYLYRSQSTQDDQDFADPFVICFQQPNIWSICGIFVLAPLELNSDQLSAFESIIPWSVSPLFGAVNQDFFDNYLRELCIKYAEIYTLPKLKTHKGIPCEHNSLDPSLAIEFPEESPEISDAGERIELRGLSLLDIDEMVKNYEFSTAFSRRQIELCSQNTASCGLYVDGVLACSAVLSPAGLINALHTVERFRRRGFGVRVMKEMARKVSLMGLIPVAENELWNLPSKNTQFKVGFQKIELTNWVGHEKNRG